MVPRKAILWVAVAFGLVLSARPAFASAITFSAAGADIASITPTVNAFRAAIGGVNNMNSAGPLASGRREINWDGGGAATTSSPTPFNGFQNIRGALFTTPGTGFLQARLRPASVAAGGRQTQTDRPSRCLSFSSLQVLHSSCFM